MKIHSSRSAFGRMFPRAGLAASLLLATAGTSASAQDGPERQWSHKEWRAEFDQGRCAIWTGGDGAGTFRIAFDMGGFNGSADYLPIVYSSEPVPLRSDDAFELVIDKTLSEFGDEMSFYDGPDAYGRYMVGASLTGGLVPDLVKAFRGGSDATMRVRHSGEAVHDVDDFSLSGFTAAYLKIADWCHFDPDNLFRS